MTIHVCLKILVSEKSFAQTLREESGNNNTFPRRHPVHFQMDLFWEHLVEP